MAHTSATVSAVPIWSPSLDGAAQQAENSPEARSSMFQLIRRVRTEAQSFKDALSAAPDPQHRWDVLGCRRLLSKIWWLLLHEHTSPPRLAAAVLLGVLIGVSPFYGFHVIGALSLSWLLRLNKLVVWLGTNISLPFISPFFAVTSIQIGFYFRHGRPIGFSFDEIRELGLGEVFFYWLLGFPVVGVVVGGILAAIVFLVARRRQARKSAADPA